MLFNLIKYGFMAMIKDDYKVMMPVYDGILSNDEIIASLSYIKSKWPEEVIEIHNKINENTNPRLIEPAIDHQEQILLDLTQVHRSSSN
tara:strand:+ start:166 stop:432 length:267 start_codon:yes stop_codon:yes gene_type:complete